MWLSYWKTRSLFIIEICKIHLILQYVGQKRIKEENIFALWICSWNSEIDKIILRIDILEIIIDIIHVKMIKIYYCDLWQLWYLQQTSSNNTYKLEVLSPMPSLCIFDTYNLCSTQFVHLYYDFFFFINNRYICWWHKYNNNFQRAYEFFFITKRVYILLL